LPPFPPVALRVLELLSKDEVETREVVDAFLVDGAFAAELLRVANSPLFALPQGVKTVRHAVVILGQDRLRSLTVTVALRAYLKPGRRGSAVRKCWHHSLACALMAEELAPRCSLSPDLAYIAGLLHDIGRLGLLAGFPTQYTVMFHAAQRSATDVRRLERDRFGVDHCDVGRYLAGQWNLPRELASVVVHHHEPPGPEEPMLLTLVRFSCGLATTLGFEAVRPYPAQIVEERLKEFSEVAAPLWQVDPEEFRTRVTGRLHSVELRSM
jgi:putative nucleotidyltransferase with HDIG domain